VAVKCLCLVADSQGSKVEIHAYGRVNQSVYVLVDEVEPYEGEAFKRVVDIVDK